MSTRPSARRRAIDARLGLVRADAPAGRAPMVTMPGTVGVLIAVMVGVFVLQALPLGLTRQIDWALGFIPARFVAGMVGQVSLAETIVPLFGHVFVHGNLGHLLLNVVWMAVFGTGVARRMLIEAPREGGPGRRHGRNTALFLAFFFASGMAGALTYALLNPGSTLLVGASGAISGLMAAAMRFALRPFAPYGPAYGPLASPHARPVLAATVVYVGFNLMTALGLGGLFGSGLDIAWEAHVGGYLFGLYAFGPVDALVRRPAPEARYAP